MIGLRWEAEPQYLLKERRVTVRHNLVDPEDTIWASYIETKDGYKILSINYTVSDEKIAKKECEGLARARIMDKIEQLEDILG